MDFSRDSTRYSMRDSNRVPRNNFSQDAPNKTFNEFFSTFWRNSSEVSPTNFPGSFLLSHPGFLVEILPGIFPKFLPGISSKKFSKKKSPGVPAELPVEIPPEIRPGISLGYSQKIPSRNFRRNSLGSLQNFYRGQPQEFHQRFPWNSSGDAQGFPPGIRIELLQELLKSSLRYFPRRFCFATQV